MCFANNSILICHRKSPQKSVSRLLNFLFQYMTTSVGLTVSKTDQGQISDESGHYKLLKSNLGLYIYRWIWMCTKWPACHASVSGGDGGEELMGLVPWLYWPAMTVHPLLGQVNGQPQYSHLAGDQRPWHARSTHPPSYTGVSNKSQINSKLTSCCLSQFKQDTGEPSVSAQEINPITYLLQTDAKPRSFHCPCKYSKQ